ncbi:hypothetical protein FACS1894186_3110 [Alphaproteobacteria bacterium]|nr:hypothetical protein FACS1894186_3110 [Alphaproteobacteria bacterium]
MVKVISLFNNKGGVSKTTTTYNLGWKLASQGFRTLLVDADPQANLTSLTLSLPDEDAFEELYNRKDSNDIYSLTLHQKNPAGMLIDSSMPVSKIVQTKKENLFILPGHLNIESFSTQITLALELGASSQFEVFRNIPGYLNYALRRIADIHKLDYILVDMAPSLGSLNEVLLMGSDFFLTPCKPDFFSEIALKNLAKVIPDWHKQVKDFKTDYPLPCAPLFLGVIQQNYRPRRTSENDDRNRPTQSFQKWVDRVRSAANEVLIPKLEKLHLVVSRQKFTDVITDSMPYDIAYISDFNSLIAASQMRNKPIFELDDADIKACTNVFGGALATQKDGVQKFNETFEKLARSIIGLTS